MCHSPKGVSAKQLERELGVHYETAWYLAKRIRKAMKHDVFEDRLCGIIEVDDAVVRASGDGLPKGHVKFEGKNVLGVAERGGFLRMMILDGLKARDIKRVIAPNLDEVQEIYSDAASRLFFQVFASEREGPDDGSGTSQLLYRWLPDNLPLS